MGALQLLEADSGPVLEDFPDDEPATAAGEQAGWACPVQFSRPAEALTGAAKIEAALTAEIAQFSPWYDKAVRSSGRTTVGLSGLGLDEVAALFASLFDDPLPPSPSDSLPLADVIRLCAEDLKAYFFEAAAAQPGAAGSRQLSDWFWQETVAADTLKQLKQRCLASDDDAIKFLGAVLLVPVAYAS